MSFFQRVRVVPVLVMTLFVSGCAFQFPKLGGKKDEEKKTAPVAGSEKREILIGTIAAVNPEYHFVLVDIGGFPSPPNKSKAKIRRAGTDITTVTFGMEQKRPFVAANFTVGEPQIGDEVYY